jgi:hypothetical protein
MSKQQWIKENLKDGEQCAGMSLGKDGQPDHHLILLPGQVEGVTWEDAKTWAEKIGGSLPNRREQSKLTKNLLQYRPDYDILLRSVNNLTPPNPLKAYHVH